MPHIIVIGTAVARKILESPLAKILPELRIIPRLVTDIMIPGQDAVWDARILQNSHVFVGFQPLIFLIRLVHQVTGVDNILHIEIVLVVGDPLHIFLIDVRIALRIVLGIRHPYKRIIIGVFSHRCRSICLGNLILHHNRNAVILVVIACQHSCAQGKIRIPGNLVIQQLPAFCRRIPGIQADLTAR
ncbi:hypothetical protein D3C76_1359650 [compost metagenome]